MRRRRASPGSPTGSLARYGPQVAVSALVVVVVLIGGALYTSHVSEYASQPPTGRRWSKWGDDAEGSLRVYINIADVDEPDAFPEVGPATAESIIEHRQTNGLYRSPEELEEAFGIGPETIEAIEPFGPI